MRTCGHCTPKEDRKAMYPRHINYRYRKDTQEQLARVKRADIVSIYTLLSLYLSVCLYVCLSVRPSVCLSVCLLIKKAMHTRCIKYEYEKDTQEQLARAKRADIVSIHSTVFISVFIYVCLSVCPSVCLSVRPSVCLSVRLSVCLSVCLSVHRKSYAYPSH